MIDILYLCRISVLYEYILYKPSYIKIAYIKVIGDVLVLIHFYIKKIKKYI